MITLEHDREKACPGCDPGQAFGKRSRSNKTLAHDPDSTRSDHGLGCANTIGTSAKILYCCERGLPLSSSLTSSSELLPRSSRGRINTRMKRLGRSAAACANTGSGPLSYQAEPGP